MYSGGGYNANQNPANGSASQSAASNYNYDNLFGSSETNAYNAQQYQVCPICPYSLVQFHLTLAVFKCPQSVHSTI
jgi:hypothetical protein